MKICKLRVTLALYVPTKYVNKQSAVHSIFVVIVRKI